MSSEKSSGELEQKLEDVLRKSPSLIYKDPIINWTGRTSDNKQYYSEIISKVLLEKIDLIKGIKKDTPPREKSYLPHSPRAHKQSEPDSKRHEDIYARELYKSEKSFKFGKIIEYQVPLKNKASDENIGKIDLIAFNKRDKILYLIELKYGNNKETLLRAILEIFTYSKLIDKDKLISDFKNKLEMTDKDDEIVIRKAVLLHPDTLAYKEAKEIDKRERQYLKELIDKLEVEIWCLNAED